MTRLNPAFTSLKTLNITYRTPQETLLSTPETLPTTEPSTPQIGYTVSETDLPILNMTPYKLTNVAFVIGAGSCPTTSVTIYWRIKKNGASVATGSSTFSGYTNYTMQAFFLDVKQNDLLELALWSNVSGCNWDYKAFQIQITRLIPINKPRVLMPCTLADFTSQPVLTLGSPSYTGVNTAPCHCDHSLSTIGTTTEYRCLIPFDTYGLFRIYYGDISSANGATCNAWTSRPRYYRNNVPTKIRFRGLNVD